MKKMLYLIVSLVSLSIILFIVFTNANNQSLNDDKIIEIGEEKYLEFLWMIDGAFHDESINNKYIVNGKKLSDDKKIFTCTYNKNNTSCEGSNFEDEFHKLFAPNISFNQVYGDGVTFNWYEYKNGKYYFYYPNNCNINNGTLEYYLEERNRSEDEIIYDVKYRNANYSHDIIDEFKLIKDNNIWKISKAIYYDSCGMEYIIE